VSLRHRQKMVLLAQVLAMGAIWIMGADCWWQHKVNVLRQKYLEHDTIDIPEAIYFDGMAVSVGIPAFLIWFGLQLTSAFIFYFNRKGVGVWRGLIFWTLWSVPWLAFFWLDLVVGKPWG